MTQAEHDRMVAEFVGPPTLMRWLFLADRTEYYAYRLALLDDAA